MHKKAIIVAISIIIVAVIAGGFIRPGFYNEKLDRVDELTPFEVNSRFKTVDFELGLDLQGGVHLLYQADLEDIPNKQQSDRMIALRDLIERRVDHFGIGEPLVQVRGERLVVELPGVQNQKQAIDEIGETPFLEFRVLDDDEERVKKIRNKRREVDLTLDESPSEISIEDLTEEEKSTLDEEIDDWKMAFEDEFVSTELTGRYLTGAKTRIDQMSGEPAVSLEFNQQGAKLLQEITAENVQKPLATYLDGKQIQVATIQEEIPGGQAQISGNMNIEEAKELSRDLEIGALPVPIELISQRSVGPALGEEALTRSVRAAIVGFLMVVVFMILYYKLMGVFASLSLIIYVLFVLSVFKLISVTLTLSGIAGFALSVGMAIDANILIFSRIREEMGENTSFKKALQNGFSNAWPSIRDGNLTTILVAFILFSVSTSFVQGFATVLIIGILVSLFAAMVITRSFLYSFINTKLSEYKQLWT